jgi:hypothetical protein
MLFIHVCGPMLIAALFTSLPSVAPSRYETVTKSSKSLYRTGFFASEPREGALAETKIYSIVMGPSVSQIAVASPFCRALKIFLVEE